MGVLKARVGGAWVPIGFGATAVMTGVYTPSLTNTVPGTGGGNSAEFVYVGEANVGGRGQITVDGSIVYGTSGQTFPSSIQISLPSGYGFPVVDLSFAIGHVRFNDANAGANSRLGFVTPSASNAFRPLVGGDATAIAGLTPTTPFTWAQGDQIVYHLNAHVVRV